MAIPAGISTALVHLDAPVSFIGEDGRIHATITSSIPLVWAETGTPIGNFIENVSLDPGIPLELNLPHVDQDGFLDGSGNTVTGWSYRIEVTYEKDGQNIPFPARDFQILVGQIEVDLALIPSGEAYVPVTAPILPVTSLDGLTGEVTLEELNLDLVDNTPDSAKPVSGPQQTALDLKMTIVAANAALATKMHVSAFINVRDPQYGIVGDGVADDTAAIQALFTGLAPHTVLHFPAGKYKHTNLVIDGKANFAIVGEEAVFIATTRTARYLDVKNCTDFTIRGITSSGAIATTRQGVTRGISLETCGRYLIEGCHVYNTEGVGIMSAKGCYDGRVVGNLVHNTMADGIHTTGTSKRITIANNVLRDTGDDAIAVVSYVTSDPDGPCEDISITGNVSWHSESRGTTVAGGKNITISGNTYHDPRNAGVYAAQESSYNTYEIINVTISGNTITGANTYGYVTNYAGIHVIGDGGLARPTRNITISNNTVDNSRFHGILVGAAGVGLYTVVLSNNIVRNSGFNGIFVQAAQDVTVVGNLVDTAGESGIQCVNSLGVVTVIGNTVKDPNRTSVATSKRGIWIGCPALARAVVASNAVHDSTALSNAMLDFSTTVGPVLAYGNNVGQNMINYPLASSAPFISPGSALFGGSFETSGLGGGIGVIGLRNANTIPASNPSSGGILYSQDGAAMWRTSGGTVRSVVGNSTITSVNYTALASDAVILANGGAAGITVTLPAGVKGQRHIIKKVDAAVGVVTVATTSAQTIDGALTHVLSGRYDTLMLESDGNVWYILGRPGDVLTSANGTRYRLGVADDGALTTTSL